MALPIQSYPIYNTTIPSTNQKITFRPYTVAEEKSLLIASETGDESSMSDTLDTVIKSCIQEDIDIKSLASFDTEYLFIQIRAKSKGEYVELVMKCDDTCTDYKKSSIDVEINLMDIKVVFDETCDKNIKLSEKLGIMMKYPTSDLISTAKNLDDIEIVSACIDYIYSDDEVWNAKDSSPEELKQFIANLLPDQLEKVLVFFKVLPSLKYKFEYTCNVCGKKHEKVINGFSNFFI